MTRGELDTYFDSYEAIPINKGENFFDSVQGYGFDPFCIHAICQKPSFIDCTCDTTEVELQSDQARMINGPTTVERGLSDETFTLLASDSRALVSIGGGHRHAVIFDTGASLRITFDRLSNLLTYLHFIHSIMTEEADTLYGTTI